MRDIADLEHFVLAPGELLILRCKRPLPDEQISWVRQEVERILPGRPVLFLGPDIEVRAGMIEVFGAPQPATADASEDDIAAQRAELIAAYYAGKQVWVRDEDGEWFYIHRSANPHTFDWERYNYALHKPKPPQ